jgi:hypothetical protein
MCVLRYCPELCDQTPTIGLREMVRIEDDVGFCAPE